MAPTTKQILQRFQRGPADRAGLCVPVAIANASIAIQKPLDLQTLVRRMEANYALLPGEGRVQNLQAAVNAVQAYARQHGVNVTYHHRVPRPDLSKFGVPEKLVLPQPRCLVVSLDNTYMQRYHAVIDQNPEPIQPPSGGPDHMVTLLSIGASYATFFDPDKSLKKEHNLAGYPPGTVRLDVNTFDAHYNLGEIPTEAVLVEVFYAPSKPKAKPKALGPQRTLEGIL